MANIINDFQAMETAAQLSLPSRWALTALPAEGTTGKGTASAVPDSRRKIRGALAPEGG